jgi:3-carboxy-cis,cis-muconate cycloisomerase
MHLLDDFYPDNHMRTIWSLESTISYWLRVESELAGALADADIISIEDARMISQACSLEKIDISRLILESKNVGYPIVSLVSMICEALPANQAGKVHWGATTQDIMDSALVLQVRDSLTYVLELQKQLGDCIADLAHTHATTVMAGRTHGKQATPTTFGAKCAVFLDQIISDRSRLIDSYERMSFVSLHGAAGTSAALYPHGIKVRSALARRLALENSLIPWHVNRSAIVAVGDGISATLQTLTRLAREIIDLSRTEIAELSEGSSLYKGASSTMPQKANPIESESIIGFGISGITHALALHRASEAAHERSAGEWQIEWRVLPDIFNCVASALSLAVTMSKNLQVFPDLMRANCSFDGGLLLAEAAMMHIAPQMGRDSAHKLLYEVCRDSRKHQYSFEATLRENLGERYQELFDGFSFDPSDHVGEAPLVALEGAKLWSETAINLTGR